MAAKSLKDYICEVAFPVGTVYMTTRNITAAQVGQIRGGVWTQLTDCYLVGAGTATDGYGVSRTFSLTLTKAGSNTISAIPPHTHSMSSSGAHTHQTKYLNLTAGSGSYDVGVYDGGSTAAMVLTSGSSHSHTTSAPSGASSENRPYTYAAKIFYKTSL